MCAILKLLCVYCVHYCKFYNQFTNRQNRAFIQDSIMAQTVSEHSVILFEMGCGLLARLYLVKNDILSSSAKRQQNQSEISFVEKDNSKFGFLDNLGLIKLLRKLEKTYPLFDPTILNEVRYVENLDHLINLIICEYGSCLFLSNGMLITLCI